MTFTLNSSRPFLLLLLILCLACDTEEKEKPAIARIDFEAFREHLMRAQNPAESARWDSLIFNRIEDSSLMRHLPKCWAKDLYENKVNLALMINQPTLMIITSPFSNWGPVQIAKEMPGIMAKSEFKPRVMILLLRESRPELNKLPEDFYRIQLEQLSQLYPTTYTIDEKEAAKLNVYALPCRYYFNAEGKLVELSKGSLSPGKMVKEIEGVFD